MVEDFIRSKGLLTLGSRLRRIGERLQAETQQVMAEHGVPLQAGQYPILAALDENGPLSIGALANALGVSQPGITRSVGQLARQGIVTVERSDADQRTRMVALTDTGRQWVEHGRTVVWPLIEACVAELAAGQSGPLLAQLDHLEQGLAETSFAQRIAASQGVRSHG